MSDPSGTRFRKGRSGNPAGRPRKAAAKAEGINDPSVFAVILDQTITVREGDRARELSAEEALHLKTYQQAIGGSRLAQRAVMKMIQKREAWLASRRPADPPVKLRRTYADREHRAANAMVVLGIAAPDHANDDRLLLEPWAVKAALERRRGVRLDRRNLATMRVAVRDWTSLDVARYRDD